MGHIAHLRNLGPYENIFPISNMHFISICLIRPSRVMILTNLPSFYVRKLSCKIQLFWRHSSYEEDIPFSHLCDYLPFEEDLALYLNKLEFLSTKHNLYQV
jgi:hypothetical protein